MAKIKLTESTFSMIPEGVTTFKVTNVDDSKYEDFGKLSVELATSKGQKHFENFALRKANDELNEGALKAWSYFAKTCLNNFQVEEIDTQDIVGCYIKATVKHEKFTFTKGDKVGQEGTAVRLNDYTTAIGFDNQVAKAQEVAEDDMDDLDDLDELDDL
jgi:hypothetical protein